MAYRQIHIDIWDDPWFLEQEAGGKLLYIYLFSNKRTCLLGLYEVSRRAIAFETGLSMQAIDELMDQFEQAGKIHTADNWVWVPKLLTRNSDNLRSPKTQTHITNLLKKIPDKCPLKSKWVQYYNSVVVPQYGINAISMPHPEPEIPSVPVPVPVSVSVSVPVSVTGDNGSGDAGSALDTYVKIRGGAVNPLDVDQINDLVDEFDTHLGGLPRGSPGADLSGERWVVTAIEEANAALADTIPSLNYIKAILDRWRTEGFKSKRGGAEQTTTSDGRTLITVQQ